MKTADAIQHYGTAAKVAKTLGISRAAVSRWRDTVPPAPASILEKLSGGALVFDPQIYVKKCGRRRAAEAQDRAA